MASVCFYFQVHQPFRLRRYSVFDTDRHYFDDHKNAEICRKVAQQMLSSGQPDAARHDPAFTRADSASAYSITGTALEQIQQYAPEVMDSFHELNKTGCVEFLDETYYHSLVVSLFARRIPRPGRAASPAHQASVRAGAARLPQYRTDLQQRSRPFRQPHGVRRDPGRRGRSTFWAIAAPISSIARRTPRKLKLLLKNYRLSDDIAFRFSNRILGAVAADGRKIRQLGQPDQRQRIHLQPVHGLRNLRRASVGRHRHL